MDYRAYLSRLPVFRSASVDAVLRAGEIDDRITDDALVFDAAQQLIEEALDGGSLSPRVWRAFIANVRKLRGVKRIDGQPYATHPTRMALTIAAALPERDAMRESSIVYALLHDYLEEGEGVAPQGIELMQQEVEGEWGGVLAAVVLSEPIIPFDSMMPRFGREVAYVAQLQSVLPRMVYAAPFANASLVDKLDNLHDLGYITQRKNMSLERKRERLAIKLAYFQFVLDTAGLYASPVLQALLGEALEARATAFELSEGDIAAPLGEMRRLLDQHRAELGTRIRAFHRALVQGAGLNGSHVARAAAANKWIITGT